MWIRLVPWNSVDVYIWIGLVSPMEQCRRVYMDRFGPMEECKRVCMFSLKAALDYILTNAYIR